jgi:hypothetical protein
MSLCMGNVQGILIIWSAFYWWSICIPKNYCPIKKQAIKIIVLKGKLG